MIGTGEEQDVNRKGTEEEQKRIRRLTGEDQDGTELERGRHESMRGTGEEQRNPSGTYRVSGRKGQEKDRNKRGTGE
jgi:hypothetical protein